MKKRMSVSEAAEHMLRAESELIPCPFCGGLAQHMCGLQPIGMDEHWVECTVCGVAGRMRGTRQHAIDAWNTRAK